MISRIVIVAVLALVFCQSAEAGPVFSLIGSNGTAAPHPTGVGTRVASGFWGFAATGGGFMDGTITFADGFALPTNPGDLTAFTAADISDIVFNHTESAFIGGGPILPAFSWTAAAGNITSATGFVFNNGGGLFTLVNPQIQTDVPASLFRIPGGTVAGDWFIDNITTGLLAETIGGFPQPPNTKAPFVINSEYKGGWQQTGDTTPAPGAPEPASLVLLGAGAALLAWRRRR